MRRGHTIDPPTVPLGLRRHLGCAADRRGKKTRCCGFAAQALERPRTPEPQYHREQNGHRDPRRESNDQPHDLRGEVQTQRKTDDPLPRLARIRHRAKPHGTHVDHCDHDQGAGEPWQWQPDPQSKRCTEECNCNRLERRVRGEKNAR